MKEDLAGGKLPSSDFKENAAWWGIMVLAMNLHAAMKQRALGESWRTKRLKAVRFSLISLPGRSIDHARELVVRLVKGHPSLKVRPRCTAADYGRSFTCRQDSAMEKSLQTTDTRQRHPLKERCIQKQAQEEATTVSP